MQALVVFKTAEEAQKALTKDREFFCESKFGTRFVRVLVDETTTATHNSSEEQTSSGHSKQIRNNNTSAPSVLSNPTPRPSPNHDQKTAIKISGLPPNITITEVVQLFWGTLAKSGSTVVHTDPSKPQARSYMDLGAPEAAAHAVLMWNGTVMTTAAGKFTLTVQLASQLEYKTAAAVKNKKSDLFGSEDDAVVVKVRGLPIKASLQDILGFLDGYKIKQQQGNDGVAAAAVHIQPLLGENRHSKVAYVEFESATEATRALNKNQTLFGKAFGDRYCILQKISRQEMMAEIARNSVATTAPATGGPLYSNDTSFSNGSLNFTTSCASPAAFFNMHQYPGGNAAAAFMMPPPCGAAAYPPLPYAQMPWGIPPSRYFPQFANMMQQQQQFTILPGAQMWQQQQQQLEHAPAPPMQQANPGDGARYLVQDLSTGQKVYLDPRFNLHHGTGAGVADVCGGDGGFLAAPPGAAPCAAVNAAAMFSPLGMAADVPLAPLMSDAARYSIQGGGNSPPKQPTGKWTPAAAAAERRVAVPTSPPQPSNECSHHTTTEAQMAGRELAAGQDSNEGSEDQGLEHFPEPPAVAAGATGGLEGDKGSDQGSEDGAGGGDQDKKHQRYYHHHHHHHAMTGKATVIVPPDYSIAPKDGHKRHSMELDLPGDDRPLKHLHIEGR